MKTAFFGGSFDPPHTGHFNLGKNILERGLAEKVLFVPAWQAPHKIGGASASWEDRFAMLRLMTENCENFEVSDVEKHLGGISYSIVTLDFLSNKNPGTEYFLVLGSDSLLTLHLWYKADELLERYGIIGWPRPGYPVSRERLAEHWKNEKKLEKLLSSFHEGLPETDVSSTELREKLAENGLTDGLLNDKVRTYIHNRSLYQ